jgi:anti-sigma B factor antagonist
VLQLNRETRAGWCVVAVSGRADAESADQFETALRAAIGDHPKVAADLAALDYISSAGLRAVLQAARAAESCGCEFAVVSLSPPVRRVFDMSGMHHIVRIEGELPC